MTDKEKESNSKSTEKTNSKQNQKTSTLIDKAGKPYKKRISEGERDKRVLEIFDLLMDGVPTPEILLYIKNEFGVEQVQAYTYLRHARNLRIGVAQSFAKGKYAAQQQKIVEEMWLLYEAEATTVKQKMDILVNLEKICKGEVASKDKKVDKWAKDMSNENLLKLVQTGKASDDKKE